MKKSVFIFTAILVLMLMFATPVFATKSSYSSGWWDNYTGTTYDIHSDTQGVGFEGTVTQPEKPGQAQKAMFDGTVDGIEGTCLVNVRTFNKRGVMSGAILQCYDLLAGLQGTFRGSFVSDDPFWGYFEAWYHFDPKP